MKDVFEESLRLLDIDYIDWDIIIKNGILDYARELKAKGLIHHIGLSSHNPQVALKAVESDSIEVLMFSVNPCYDLQPASEDVEQLWADEAYEKSSHEHGS